VLPDSGDPVPVHGAAWSPGKGAWILETPPLRANARHRVEVRGRPEFPGRPGGDAIDTSAVFIAELPGIAPEWTVAPVLTGENAGPTGLPRAVASPLPGARQVFASNLPLSAERWAVVENQMRVYAGDTVPVSFRARRADPVTFVIDLVLPLRAGSSLELRLLPAAGDTSQPRALYSGKAPDSSRLGGLRFVPPASRRGWNFWLRDITVASTLDYTLIRTGDSLKVAPLPAGRYRLLAFRDRDGDGVWDAGAIKPWIPQETLETVLDSVTVTPGTAVDVTGRLAP
jgi:hypothetical protein